MYHWCRIKGTCVHERGRRVTALLWFRFDRDHVALPPQKPGCLYFADGIYSARSATQSALLLNKSLNCKSSRHTETQHRHTRPVICMHTHTHAHMHAHTHWHTHTYRLYVCKLGWMCNLTHTHMFTGFCALTPKNGIYSERLVTQSAL